MGDVYVKPGGGGTDLDAITASTGDVLAGKIIVDREGEPVAGTMPNRGAWSGSAGMNGSVAVPAGYHNGSGRVTGPSITDRGAWGTTIGINGSVTIPQGYHNGAGKVTQSIATLGGQTITPTKSQQTVSCSGKYMTGNVTVSAIPSNFVDLTGGRVGFNSTAFYSPLDGGVRSDSTSGGYFNGVSSYNGYYGIVTKVYRNNIYNICCCHSVNLSGVSRIKVNVVHNNDPKHLATKVYILDLKEKTVASNGADYTNNIVNEIIVDVSILNGHHFIRFAHAASSGVSSSTSAFIIQKITFS